MVEVQPLFLKVRDMFLAQWLIGRFVRVSHSESDLINCAGVGRRTKIRKFWILSHSLFFLFGLQIIKRFHALYFLDKNSF